MVLQRERINTLGLGLVQVDTPAPAPGYTLVLGKCERRHLQKEIWGAQEYIILFLKTPTTQRRA